MRMNHIKSKIVAKKELANDTRLIREKKHTTNVQQHNQNWIWFNGKQSNHIANFRIGIRSQYTRSMRVEPVFDSFERYVCIRVYRVSPTIVAVYFFGPKGTR